ncbi:MAG: filamentous hemagglutinin N-terminal domain-containing protein [Candidatus Eremiobacteraeota bacterium]|nr:filamentous hemagglutinin N-terminal domain-containing protein [Candidatus Eremiobacteraeota bacterium]MCW5867128.1 filamentous hemagglutinin N-terminal domain-containing protein [Candidatus Eremiobacteraeota bacterium]
MLRPAKTILGTLFALGLNSNLWALPQDPSPVHGQVQIENGANFVQILQQTPQAIINWGQFNIGLGETVRFLQPGQQAAILNRVTGLDPSVIQGMLQANGRVFLLNPNGILFGPNAVVDVGSFTASTLKMSDEDFLNGTYKLTQDNSLPLAALTNQGTIRVAEGGFVVLVSPLLDNQGMIVAQSGHVNLGATTQATFSVDGRGLVQFAVPDGFDPQFQGGGQGGTVLLQPGQMSQLLSQVVSNPALVEAGSFQAGSNGQVLAHGAEGLLLNSGVVSTDSAAGNGGTIRLDSSQATILPTSGRLSADSHSAAGGDVRLLSAGRTVSLGTISAAANGTGQGGFAEVSGKDLWLLGTVNVGSAQGTGGTILLDPTDITIIDGAGGTFDSQLPNPNGAGPGTVSVTAMQGQGSVQLVATNDVLYNGAGFNLGATSLSVTAGNDILFTTGGSIQAATLTLLADRDITISSSGSLTLGSTSGVLTVQAGRDLTLTANTNLFVSSSGSSRLEAGRHLNTTSGNGAVTRLTASLTELVAGQNLTMTASNLDQIGDHPVLMGGRNVTLQNPNGSLSFQVGSLNVTAAENFAGNTGTNGGFNLRTLSGPLDVTAGAALNVEAGGGISFRSEADRLTLAAPTVQVRAANGGTSLQGAQGVNVTASSGDFNARASGGQELRLEGGSGTVNVTAARDINLSAGTNLFLSSSGGNRLEAGRHLNTTSSNGAVTRLTGALTELVAGQNLTMTASNLDQSTNHPVLLSGRNVTLQNPNGNLDFRVGSLNVTAAENFTGNANGNFFVGTLNGPLEATTGANFSVATTGSAGLQAASGGVELTAGNLALSNVAISALNNGPLNLTSSGNLSVGSLTTNANANTTLTGANITINSMQNISGGNYTITTPGNLTEITPATGPPSLTALNIEAGRVFNLNRPDLGFSIPNAGTISALVTGGNETNLPNGQEDRAAAFHTFNGATVDPGHIDFQTGDIYVDGIQVYGGLKPPAPPSPPPSPPPIPDPPPMPASPVETPLTPEQAVQRENAITPEERSQILAQSNLALGNLGSFSRVLSDAERERLTTRHDSLHQTWSLDPFSPTLALTVPGGVPPVYPSELARLQALLMMSSPVDDPEDKNRQAYNVIVDQELREIWEVRYWRHLLEAFIIWEDRE